MPFLLGALAYWAPSAIAAEDSSGKAPASSLGLCGDDFPLDRITPADVAIVIDASYTTAAASGVDIDGDGRVAQAPPRDDAFDPDPKAKGDSLLAAQVRAAKALAPHLGVLPVRLAIVVFSAADAPPAVEGRGASRTPGAVVVAELTDDAAALERALDAVFSAGSAGGSRFSVGMRAAIDTFSYDAPKRADARRVVLFLADSPHPRFVDDEGRQKIVDPPMQDAAQAAIAGSIVFYTFGLGEASHVEPPHTLSRVAGATGGRYVAIRNPSTLHCSLLATLMP